MSSKIKLLLLAVFITQSGILPVCFAQELPEGFPDVSSPMKASDLQDEQTFGDYKIQIYRNMRSGFSELRVLKKGLEVFSQGGFVFKIGLINDDIPGNKLVKVGNDINKDGQPDLVVSEWSGGAHCCIDYYVFSLGDQVKQVGFIESKDGDGEFVDVDNDGILEFIGNDWTFAYWNASFAGSPAPQVILEYKNAGYQLTLKKMRKPLDEIYYKNFLKNTTLSKINATMNAKSGWSNGEVSVPPEVWGYMLDLIYSGHSQEAFTLIDTIWPKGVKGKEDFLKDFKGQLSQSPFWKDIKSVL